MALGRLATPRFLRPRAPLPFQLLFLPFAAHFVILRGLDMVGDIYVDATTEDKTLPPVVAVLLDLLRDARGLSLTFLTSGHLSGYSADPTQTGVFKLGAAASGDQQAEWLRSYRQCLDQTFRSAGAVLRSEETKHSVTDFVSELLKWM